MTKTPSKPDTELRERLRFLISLNEPKLGGPYQGTAAAACIRAMIEAADALDILEAENARARKDALEEAARVNEAEMAEIEKLAASDDPDDVRLYAMRLAVFGILKRAAAAIRALAAGERT